MEKTDKKKYSNTVFLPKTSFSMKANLNQKEPDILKFWNEINIYGKLREKNKRSQKFFLHDGPPYANGHIHIGHALNKILKDFVVKSHFLMGYDSPYIPGWDCHGLPIEQQLLKELNISKRHINDITEFRKKARDFAQKFINIQREEFKRLGVFGEWEKPYITMSNEYESSVIRSFLELFEKGYIERDKKTIYWCPVCETALADAEVEYKDKISDSIFVKFKIKKVSEKLKEFDNIYLVIWTTTPWTLPANMAVAVARDEDYSVILANGEYIIVAKKLLETFANSTKIKYEEKLVIKGENLIGMEYEPPLVDLLDEKHKYLRKIIYTDFVDMTTGSGMVHIAPGHGEEDYFAGKKWNIEVFCPVDESGRFVSDIKELGGKFVFEANKDVIKILDDKGLLLGHSEINHSYPHCWRCKKPIIFRATEQWFLKIDKNSLRENLLNAIAKVNWIPESGYERISSMVKIRPDWCLSRQRHWGTPIITFYCKKCGKIQNDLSILYKIVDRIKKEGSDFWFSEPISEIIGKDYICECGGKDFEKEKDILDVWLDSGVSWRSVCKEQENIYPVDLYLEGSDQHRGWFQTSLIPSVALNSVAPYKLVLTHGFVLDENGKAMHKSLGNVVLPEEVIKKYGAEILRLWVALSNWHEDVRISEKLLSIPIDMYRKIRNTFRYLLGNLSGFSVNNSINYEDMLDIDKYMLIKLTKLNEKVVENYKKFEYSLAIRNISDFCITDLSSFYLDVLKDRLYTMSLLSFERRSAQTAMYQILKSLLLLSSPILSFTAEEAWQVLRKDIDNSVSESVFLNDINAFSYNYDDIIIEKWEKILKIREKALKEIENLRKKGEIGSSLDVRLVFYCGGEDFEFINKHINDIVSACIVSQGEVRKIDKGFKIEAIKAYGEKCPRCWQWSVEIGKKEKYPDLCPKCADALEENSKNV
ncbi:MAG: isoleucine--tRNA ligase [Elusimicrobiota bacterium]